MYDTCAVPSSRTAFDPSPTLRINELVQKMKADGKDVISFGAGAPKLAPSDEIIKAIASLDLGQLYTYGATKGDVTLIDSIHKWNQSLCYKAVTGRDIQVTAGAKEAVFLSMLTICDAGDYIGIVRPYWPSYIEMAKALNLKVMLLEEDVFLRDSSRLGELLDRVGPRIKLLIFSSPSNPTGVSFDLDVLNRIAENSARFGFWVIADEIYQMLEYRNGADRSPSILDVSTAVAKRCIQVNSASKCLSLMGLRCGWVNGPTRFIQALSTAVSNLEGHPDRIAQHLTSIGLNEALALQRRRSETMVERRDLMIGEIVKVPWLEAKVPNAGMFLWTKIVDSSLSSLEVSELLLVKQGVAVVPGDAFGAPGYLRLSFGEELDDIKSGIRRIASFELPELPRRNRLLS